MIQRCRRVGVISAVVGVFGLVGGPAASASAAPGAAEGATTTSVQSISTWVSGVPSRVAVGGTVNVTLWFRLQTRQPFAPLNFQLDLGSMGPAGAAQYRGISVAFYNPATHKWGKPVPAHNGADFIFDVGGAYPSVKYKPGSLDQASFRVTFAKGTYLGRWNIFGGVGGCLLPVGGGFDCGSWTESMKNTWFSVTR